VATSLANLHEPKTLKCPEGGGPGNAGQFRHERER
jgi:hypothetical protein